VKAPGSELLLNENMNKLILPLLSNPHVLEIYRDFFDDP
jgi:hypothetical protein